MRIFGNSPSVNMWRKHYESMGNGHLKRNRTRVSGRAGFVNTYQVNNVQSGGGNVSPIKLVSPTEASVDQAKMQIQHSKVQNSLNQRNSSVQKKKQPPKAKRKKTSPNSIKKKQRKIQDIFS